MKNEYSVSNSGIIEFYGSLNECVEYLVEHSQYMRQAWLLSPVSERG